VRDLLGDLVGKPVAVAPADALELAEGSPAYAATYRFDDGRVAALAVCDLRAATALGAAIGFMTRGDAEAELDEQGELTGDLFDFFREVVNVLAKLLNSPTSPHVALREVDRVPGPVRADIGRVALRPRDRADYAVTLDGFESGALAVLTA
jgi:hypothetical protein